MREPDFELDGWCLDDGEERHREAPATFWIPELARRQALVRGEFAKLIFRIAVRSEEEPVAVERMWVIVRERRDGGYLGVLVNKPRSIVENDDLCPGLELPFSPRHVVNIESANAESVAEATGEPWRRWTD